MASSTCRWATSRALEPNQRWPRIHERRASSSRKARSPAPTEPATSAIARLLELEPEVAARGERQEVGQLPDRRKAAAPEHLLGKPTLERGQVELDRLRRAGQVVDTE